MLDYILFFGLGLVAIASAAGLLVSKSAIYAALSLILNFTAIAIFYLVLAAPFLALAQIAVYAGAIMVLFLFVIMLLGAEKLGSSSTLPWQRWLAYILGGILMVEAVVAFAILARSGAATAAAAAAPANFGSPEEIGNNLFAGYLLPFEVISILLLAAMVGAIVLTRKGAPRVWQNSK